MTIPLDFTWLREELKKPGRSQTDLAKHMNLHVSAVNKILNGTRSLKLNEYRQILEYLGTDLAEGLSEFHRYSEDKVIAQMSDPSPISLVDADWVLMRSDAMPPGSEQSIERYLLSALVEDDGTELYLKCRREIIGELGKAIILQMNSFTERHADRLGEFLLDPQLAVLLGRGLAILDEDDARQITSLNVAIALANSDEGPGQKFTEELRRASGALPNDSIERMRAKLVKFTTELYARLVSTQKARIAAVHSLLNNVEGVRERLRQNALGRIERKSKRDIDA